MADERRNWLAPEDKQWLVMLSQEIWNDGAGEEQRCLTVQELETLDECFAYSNNLFCKLSLCPCNVLCLDIFQVPAPKQPGPKLLIRLTEKHLPAEVNGCHFDQKLLAESIFGYYAGSPSNLMLLDIYTRKKLGKAGN